MINADFSDPPLFPLPPFPRQGDKREIKTNKEAYFASRRHRAAMMVFPPITLEVSVSPPFCSLPLSGSPPTPFCLFLLLEKEAEPPVSQSKTAEETELPLPLEKAPLF